MFITRDIYYLESFLILDFEEFRISEFRFRISEMRNSEWQLRNVLDSDF